MQTRRSQRDRADLEITMPWMFASLLLGCPSPTPQVKPEPTPAPAAKAPEPAPVDTGKAAAGEDKAPKAAPHPDAAGEGEDNEMD